jgi:hypothetical protein
MLAHPKLPEDTHFVRLNSEITSKERAPTVKKNKIKWIFMGCLFFFLDRHQPNIQLFSLKLSKPREREKIMANRDI